MPAGPSVFLSHSAPDKPFVRWLGNHLRTEGARVWIDESEIKVGESLIDKISAGIDTCDYVAAILSQHSIQSEWVKRELNIALTQEIKGRRVKVLPLVIGKCDIPLFLLDKKFLSFDNPEYPNLDSLNSLVDDIGLTGRDASDKFFKNFISYDCYDQNNGFDVDVIQHFRPPIMEKILRRLWFFGAEVHGMDIAVYNGEMDRTSGGGWTVVDADWPQGENADKLDSWIEFIHQNHLKDTALSISFTIPEDVLELFMRRHPDEILDKFSHRFKSI